MPLWRYKETAKKEEKNKYEVKERKFHMKNVYFVRQMFFSQIKLANIRNR